MILTNESIGDSGGPAFISNGTSVELVGVVSFGINCDYNADAPVVFSKVRPDLSWIESVVKNTNMTA